MIQNKFLYFRNWNRINKYKEKLFRILILTIYSRPSNCRTIEIETRQLFKKMHRCFGNWHRFLFRFHFTGKYLLNDQDKKKEFAKSLFYMYLKFPLKVLLKIILRQLNGYIFIIILLDRKELNEIVILNNSQRIKRGYVLESHYSKSKKIN